MKSIIFNLDQTLIDSSIAERARHNNNWNEVYSLIPEFTLYNGLKDIFKFIRENKIKVCIVSTSPKTYVGKVTKCFNIPYNHIIAYHDVKHIKPDPEAMLKALDLMEESTGNVISFGDRTMDIEASNSAGIESVACLWGTKEKIELLNSNFTYAIKSPLKIMKFLKSSICEQKTKKLTQESKDLNLIIKAAEQGYTRAQCRLGNMYRDGQGVSKDYTETFKWFQKAAKQGDVRAQNSIGFMYKNGQGVSKDYTEAFKWFQKAAEQGYVRAQYRLGIMYYHGQGVSKDYTEAFKWFQKAAKQGYKKAQNCLAFMFEKG